MTELRLSTESRAASQLAGVLGVLWERDRQDLKWGIQYHNFVEWLAILHEETGELAKECLAAHFGNSVPPNLRSETVQVAAVALAIIEAIDEGRILK